MAKGSFESEGATKGLFIKMLDFNFKIMIKNKSYLSCTCEISESKI